MNFARTRKLLKRVRLKMSEMPLVISNFIGANIWNVIPRESVMMERNAFLKCDCYQVYLPVVNTNEKRLNIFEETVLKIASLGRVDKNKLEITTCLNSDFAQTILERLVFLNYIQEDGTISDLGILYLKEEAKINSTMEPAMVLVLQQTGDILPNIFLGQPKNKFETWLEKRKMTVTYGKSKGKPLLVTGKIWTLEKGEKSVRPKILQTQIRRLVQTHNLHHPMERIILNGSDIIEISSSPIQVFLHVKMILQRGLVGSVIVSDGNSFVNSLLTKYALERKKEEIKSLRESAVQNAQVNGDGTKRIFRRYTEVHNEMDGVQSVIIKDDTVDGIMQARKTRNNYLSHMYAAVEWAFAYFIKLWPVDESRMQSLLVCNSLQNKRILLQIAKNLGFRIRKESNEDGLLARLDNAMIEQYKNSGIPNLYTLLPLAIASSKDNPSTSLRTIAREMPGIFRIFNRLAATRELRHGTEYVQDDFSDYEELKVNTERFLRLLLPGYDAEDTRIINEINEDASQIKLNGEVLVDNYLGREIYDKFGQRLQSDLRTLALFNGRSSTLCPLDFIMCLARVAENYLRTRAKEIPSFLRRSKIELLGYINDNAKVLDNDYSMPKEITTVSEKKIDAASKHRNGSLGAYTLIYLGNLDKSQLLEIDVTFVLNCISEILCYRGHGNNINLELSDTKMYSMCDALFKIIKKMEKYT